MKNKIALVARHEFISTLKRRSALFAIFGLPVLSLLILTGINWLIESQSSGDANALSSFVFDSDKVALPAGLVDETDQLTQLSPPADTIFSLYPDIGTAEIAFEAEEINGYYQIPANFLTNGEIFQFAEDVPLGSSEEYVLYSLLAENFIKDDVPVTRIISPIQQYDEYDLSATNSRSDQNYFASIGLAMSIAILFYLTVMGASGYLLQSLGKEKENRVMEILLSSLRPFQLLTGKVLGLGGIGLLQMGVWSFLGFVVFQRGGSLFSNIGLPTMTALSWILIILHFIAGYLVYASLFAGLGAIVPNVKEGSQYTFLFMLPTLLPMWFNSIMISAPNGSFATWLSLIPLTAPIAMPIRLALTAVPVWQWLCSLTASLGTAAFLLWGATKIFSGQTLLTGQKFSIKLVVKTLRST